MPLDTPPQSCFERLGDKSFAVRRDLCTCVSSMEYGKYGPKGLHFGPEFIASWVGEDCDGVHIG